MSEQVVFILETEATTAEEERVRLNVLDLDVFSAIVTPRENRLTHGTHELPETIQLNLEDLVESGHLSENKTVTSEINVVMVRIS